MHPLILLILIASFGYACSIIQHYSTSPVPLTLTLFVLIITILLSIIL